MTKAKGHACISRSETFFKPQIGNTTNLTNPLNAEINPICHLLALLENHHILHVSSIRAKQIVLWTIILFQQ